MKRKIIISNKEFTMPKMSIDTYTEYLDIAEQIDAHPRYTKQDIEIKRTRFDYNGEHFYRDGKYVGKIGTNTMIGNDSQRGLVFDIEYDTAYGSVFRY